MKDKINRTFVIILIILVFCLILSISSSLGEEQKIFNYKRNQEIKINRLKRKIKIEQLEKEIKEIEKKKRD